MSNYVYLIVNKVNQKLYFGSHCWNGDGVDPNYYGSGTLIKQAVKKYGKENFIVQPIAFYDTVEECRQEEEELLTRYDIANNPNCYNLKNSAIGFEKGSKLPEKHIQKIPQAKAYKKPPIVAIQLSTGRVKLFKSQAECSRILGLCRSCVVNCLKGMQKYAGGYTFKYAELP